MMTEVEPDCSPEIHHAVKTPQKDRNKSQKTVLREEHMDTS